MKKSSKIIETVIALALVLTAMIVAIYAATIGGASIEVTVSWTAQAGVNLEFWASTIGGESSKSIEKKYITPTTTNENAKISGNLDSNFVDLTDNGVNDPNAISFNYFVKNNSTTPLNIKVTNHPTAGNEAGTLASTHIPKVVLSSKVGSINTLDLTQGVTGYDLQSGETFSYVVTLSMAKGGTNNGINADLSVSNFHADVAFNFSVGGNTNGNVSVNVAGNTAITSTASEIKGQTLREYISDKAPALNIGWFFDEEYTKVVSDAYLDQTIQDSTNLNLYTKEASLNGLAFTLSSDGTYYEVSGISADDTTAELVIPAQYEGKPVKAIKNGNWGNPTFNMNANITSIILPSSLVTIGMYGFGRTPNLTNVKIPNSIETISDCVFYRCFKLTEIVIPNSVTSMHETVMFGEDASLTKVAVEDGNPNYDSRDNCNAVIETKTNKLICGSSITKIPNSVRVLGNYCFYEVSFNNMLIPSSVTKIGYSAFTAGSSMTKIFIPKSVTTINAGSVTNSPFRACSPSLVIYCEAESAPSGWEQYWNYYADDKPLIVKYGQTMASTYNM